MTLSIDGQNIADIKIESLRNEIALVSQDIILFDDTIKNNLKFGNYDASDEQIINACKKANCEDFISKLQDGYETIVGESGVKLSGGQKQRICIARALAAEPDFVICDEVTSALDQIVQEGILKLLMRLQKDLNLTYLFITHDISTVRAISDQVVVMNLGEVVEQGPKDEVFNPPHPPYTELLLSSVPEMDPDWLTNLYSERT